MKDDVLKSTIINLERWLGWKEEEKNWSIEDFNKVTEIRAILKKLKSIV